MKSIPFDTRQVGAVLDGTITEMRIPFKFEPYRPGINLEFSGMSLGEYCTGDINSGVVLYSRGSGGSWNQRTKPVKPPFQKGDILYVQKTWQNMPNNDGDNWLWVTDVRAERLQGHKDDSREYEWVIKIKRIDGSGVSE